MPELFHKDLQNKDYLEWIDFLHSSEEWSTEKIKVYQLKELQRIIRHAFDHTSGYRNLFTQFGLRPETLETLEDFRKFPLINKETLRDNLESFSVNMKERTYCTTGGSTGIPLGLYRDSKAFSKELASKAYQYYRIGWKEGDRQVVFRGISIESDDHMQMMPDFNELRCSSYFLTPETMQNYYQRILEYRPEWVRCYPSSGYIFARFVKESGLKFPPIKGILCASENLYDHQKQMMSEVFGARVFSHYGHYELAALAGFCEKEDAYHVLPQYGYVELLDPYGKPVVEPGAIGEIVATSFIMHATPIIRYRTMDYAILKDWNCSSCGRPYQIWERIEGRLQEFIVTGNDRLISMTAINFHDDIFDHLYQFQFFQEEKGKVNFLYIPRDSCNSRGLEAIHKRLMVKMGNDVSLTMTPVKEIPLTKRGKHRFLIQKLAVHYHDEGFES